LHHRHIRVSAGAFLAVRLAILIWAILAWAGLPGGMPHAYATPLN